MTPPYPQPPSTPPDIRHASVRSRAPGRASPRRVRRLDRGWRCGGWSWRMRARDPVITTHLVPWPHRRAPCTPRTSATTCANASAGRTIWRSCRPPSPEFRPRLPAAHDAGNNEDTPAARAAILASVPLGRFSTVEDVASPRPFLPPRNRRFLSEYVIRSMAAAASRASAARRWRFCIDAIAKFGKKVGPSTWRRVVAHNEKSPFGR